MQDLNFSPFQAGGAQCDVFLSERLANKSTRPSQGQQGHGAADQRFTFAEGLHNPSGRGGA